MALSMNLNPVSGGLPDMDEEEFYEAMARHPLMVECMKTLRSGKLTPRKRYRMEASDGSG